MLKKDFNDQNVITKTSKNQIKLATHQTIFILWLPVDHLHVLDPAKKKGEGGQTRLDHRRRVHQTPSVSPGLYDVDGHRGCRGNQTTDHTGTEVTQNIVSKIT